MEVLIIGHNEGKYIPKMLKSLSHCGYISDIIWIIDRCTDDSDAHLAFNGQTFIKTPKHLTGRQTSFCRNLGYSQTYSDVLFLDGDRYIKEGSLNNLQNYKTDIVLLLLEEDNREGINIEEAYGNIHNGFYSCGVYFKQNALEKISEFQKGQIFLEELQEDWGIEDVYLGDVCYHLGLTVSVYKECRLNGKFEKSNIDKLDTIEKRFKLREKLNVLWN